MSPNTKTLFALNAVSGLSHCAQFGVLYPLVALWLTHRGLPAWMVGVVGSVFWAGMLVGSTLAPALMHRFGARRLIWLSSGLTLAAALTMPHLPVNTDTWLVWGAVGSLVGVATGLRWIGNEAWLYSLVSAAKRGRIVGWHETLIHAVQTAGPVIIAAAGLVSAGAFVAAAVLAALCVPALWLAVVDMPAASRTINLPSPLTILKAVWAGAFSARGGFAVRLGLWAGLIDGVLFGMFAVYCTQSGVTAQTAAWVMVVFGAGGLASSAPLGIACDRYGVRRMLAVVAGLGLAGAALLSLPAQTQLLLWLGAAIMGVVAAAGLTLAMVVATLESSGESAKNATNPRDLAQSDLAQSISQVSLAFTVGTIAGPALAGWALNSWGAAGYLALTAAVCALAFAVIKNESKKLNL